MALEVDATERPAPAPPEPDLTPADVVARAEAMVPQLVRRQAETERRSYYAEDTHRQFADNGFYRILVPRRYGGYEFGVETFFEVTKVLARGCPSTAWMYCLGATHALPAASLFGGRAQAELFRDGDFICPATIVPGGSAERTADGNWLVNGTWRYCSGSPYATHFMAHALVSHGDGEPPSTLLFVVPREQWRRLDDWGDQLGLKGSGSHGITVENAVVPEYLTMPGHVSEMAVDQGTPGLALHGNPEYGGGPLSYMNMEVAALAVGMARGALDIYEEMLRTRTTLLPPIVSRAENPDYQFWYGDALGMVDTADAALRGAIRQWQDTCARGPAAFTREQDLRIAVICRHVLRLCWQAVEQHLFPTAGSSSVREGERFERVWRDMSTLQNHTGLAVFLPTVAVRDLAKTRLGLE
jgi:3-hydroxy-9,10-secoandrosta-1,3,5(10)-triene-9,17-dione monooxygenase